MTTDRQECPVGRKPQDQDMLGYTALEVFCVAVRVERTVNEITYKECLNGEDRTEAWEMSISSNHDQGLGSSPEKSKAKVAKRNG